MKRYYITVLDNGGITADRYTIVNRLTGDVFACSENPFYPTGIGQFNHNIADSYWIVAYGHNWRNNINSERAAIGEAVRSYFKGATNIGIRVSISTLPKDVLKYIDNILKP